MSFAYIQSDFFLKPVESPPISLSLTHTQYLFIENIVVGVGLFRGYVGENNVEKAAFINHQPMNRQN